MWTRTREYVAENGVRWSTYAALSSLFRAVGLSSARASMERRMSALERENDLPGRHSVRTNRRVWTEWDWEARGEEWTPEPEFKQAVIDLLMKVYLSPDTDVLEIGPGGGRWTEPLLDHVRHLVVVDLPAGATAAGAATPRWRASTPPSRATACASSPSSTPGATRGSTASPTTGTW